MKKRLILLFVFAVAQLQIHTAIAQRDPSKEILIFFKDGVQREIRLEKGITAMRSSVKSDNLKSTLRKIGIEEHALEVANPKFQEADTLKTMPDGTVLTQMNMAKLFRIKVPEGKSREDMIDELNRLPEVLYAEANGTVTHQAIPSDTRFGEQWALRNTVNLGRDIHAEAAWDIYTGSSNSIIAIIDGGTDISHTDLGNKILGGDTGWGWNGHGIHVSGIAAARSNNGNGISGVDWNAQIHPQRIDNVLDDVDIYNAIIDAVNFSSNVHVLNNSWALTDQYNMYGRNSNTIRQAFAYAYKANRTCVVSMGNNQQTQPGVVAYPAGYGNVIAVGATNNNDIVANFSAQGNHIDVSAPGVNILSTYTNGGYSARSGTSMAAPHVAGLASLLKGYNNNLSNDDIEQIIKLSADKVGPAGTNYNGGPHGGHSNEYGYGRINAGRALAMVRDNQLKHFTATGGLVMSSTGTFGMTFLGAPGLASAVYIVKRYEVIKTVHFPEQFFKIVGVWGRGVGTTGWSMANPNFGEGFCDDLSYTSTFVTLRTYVYEIFDTLGRQLGYYPASPANVTFAYTVLASYPPTISGPTEVCYSGSTFTLSNAPASAITWSVTGPFTVSGSGTTATVTRTGTSTSNGTLTAKINGTAVATKTITPCPPFVITGPALTCDPTVDYSINYLAGIPSNQVTWTCSPNLSPQGGNTGQTKRFNVTGSGTGWVRAYIAAINLTLEKNVSLTPFPAYKTHGMQYPYCGETMYMDPEIEPGVIGYRWEVVYGQGTYSLRGYSSGSFGVGALASFNGNGYWIVYAYAHTACGESPEPTHEYAFQVAGCRSYSPSFAYPNPVSGILTVDVDAAAARSKPAVQSITGAQSLKPAATYDLRLYDGQGNLLRQRKASGGMVEFNVANLPGGIYYLHIYDGTGEKPTVQQIVVEH